MSKKNVQLSSSKDKQFRYEFDVLKKFSLQVQKIIKYFLFEKEYFFFSVKTRILNYFREKFNWKHNN